MQLNQDESVNDSQVCSGIIIKIALDSNGNVASSSSTPAASNQYVWGNDQMLPVNSYYKVTGFNAKGQIAFGPNNQQVTGNGGTFDVGAWTPNSVISWTPSPQQISFQTNETLNGSQLLLDLHAGTNVTLTDNGFGRVTVAVALPNSSALHFAVPYWASPTSDWSETYYSEGAWDMKYDARTGGGGSAVVSVVAATSTVAPYWKFAEITGTASQDMKILYGNAKQTALGLTKSFKIRAAAFASSGLRYWIVLSGVSEATLTGSPYNFSTNNPPANIIGFRYTSGTDSYWTAYSGTDATHYTASASSVAVDTTGALHDFEIRTVQGTPGTVYFYIDGTFVATISSNVPTATTFMAPFLYCESFGSTLEGIGCNLVYSETFQ
jgi:hypothetical protein